MKKIKQFSIDMASNKILMTIFLKTEHASSPYGLLANFLCGGKCLFIVDQVLSENVLLLSAQMQMSLQLLIQFSLIKCREGRLDVTTNKRMKIVSKNYKNRLISP